MTIIQRSNQFLFISDQTRLLLKQIIQLKMDQRNPEQLVKIVQHMIKKEDVMHRGFLKPIEIVLKVSRSENDGEPKSSLGNSLPSGLEIVVKERLDDNKYQLKEIEEIKDTDQYWALKDGSQDNLLTLMKKQQKRLKLAICICMYSQDKNMLKKTLAGVEENITNFVARQGLDPDEIGVFVMMDGIEFVDVSIVDYFEELERRSNINLGMNVAPTLSVEELAEQAARMTSEEINAEQLKNVNNFLFNPVELQERNRMRFEEVRNSYKATQLLLSEITKLKKGRPTFEDLPSSLHQYFLRQVRKQRKIDYQQSEQDVAKINPEILIEEYATNIRTARPIVFSCLIEAEKDCKEYISTKEDMAYLSCFRKKIPFSYEQVCESRKSNGDQNVLNEQLQAWPNTVMNLFMCVKYKNGGKLSSHNWFFNGFCKELRPQYAVLLDVGLKPSEDALVKMYKYMTSHPRVGGTCGYMSLKIEKLEAEEQVKDEDVDFLTGIVNKFVDIQRAQQIQYHFAHLIDKAFESSFGFIHVLPGAFSAYNMKAIFGNYEEKDDQLLKSYFKSIDQKLKNRKVISATMGVKNAILRTALPAIINQCCISVDPHSDEAMMYDENVNLAEDRILCMGIHKKGFDMVYLPDAYAEVDPIKTVHGLLGQRKRWNNGSYFAFEKVKKELAEHEKKNGFQLCLHVQIFYLTLMNALAYFAPSVLLFTVHIAMESFREDVLLFVLQGVVTDGQNSKVYNAFVYSIDFFYVLLLITIIFLSLHFKNNHKRFKPYLYGISTIFGLFFIAVFIVLGVDVVRGLVDGQSFLRNNAQLAKQIPGGLDIINSMRWILLGSLGLYIIPILLYIFFFGKLHIICEIIIGAISFIFYTPTYLNILNVYSLCRMDDISWGTKGLDTSSTSDSSLKGSWKLIKFLHLAKFVIWNIIISTAALTLGAYYVQRFFITMGMACLIAALLLIKVFVAVFYMISYKLRGCCSCEEEKILRVTEQSRIDKMIESRFDGDIRTQIKDYLNFVKEQFIKSKPGKSFIQVSKEKKVLEASFRHYKDSQVGKTSKIKSKRTEVAKKKKYIFTEKHELAPIREVKQFPISNEQIDLSISISAENESFPHSSSNLLNKQMQVRNRDNDNQKKKMFRNVK